MTRAPVLPPLMTSALSVRDLRKRILKSLTQRGMSARAAEEALEVDVRDLALNVGQRLRPQKEEQA